MANSKKGNVQEILISKVPIPKDDGGSDIYRSPDGEFHKVIFPEGVNEDFSPVSAIQVKVKGRVQPLFVNSKN